MQLNRSKKLAGNLTADEVDADKLRRSALLWHFTVLGEAASQVPAEIRDAHPEIAWRPATRMRNRIVHGYWNIEIETLLATAEGDLPTMITALADLIASRQDDEGTNGPVTANQTTQS